MEKEKDYAETRFDAEVLQSALSALKTVAAEAKVEVKSMILSVEHDEEKWTFDNAEEFVADYRKYQGQAYFLFHSPEFVLSVRAAPRSTSVRVKAPTRVAIERVFDTFEKAAPISRLPPLPKKEPPKPVIFVGHGHSGVWRDLKDHLQDKHRIRVIAFESGARAGHSVRDILEELVSNSTFALLVLTAEDEQANGQLRARQNVVHEAGLFQGRLGFPRAVLLVEEGTEDFSNVAGIQQIRFSKGNIKETFGEVLAVLRREFNDRA